MKAAEFDRRITIEQRVDVPDALYGKSTPQWAALASNVPAQVRDVLPSKSEAVQGAVEVAALPARVRLRYMPGIDSTMRIIVHGETDRLMQIITPPAEIGRREAIEFMAREYSS